MALITSANLGEYLKIPSPNVTQTAIIATLVSKINSYVENFTGRIFESTVYNEIYDGDGSNELYVDNYPIISVSILSEDIDIDESTYDELITAYIMQKSSGKIKLYDSVFTENECGIYVKYTGGYATIPGDIYDVACSLCAKKFNDIDDKRLGIVNISMLSQNVTFQYSDMTTEQYKILMRYKRLTEKKAYEVEAFTAE